MLMRIGNHNIELVEKIFIVTPAQHYGARGVAEMK
jgi:hypothetical protein